MLPKHGYKYLTDWEKDMEYYYPRGQILRGADMIAVIEDQILVALWTEDKYYGWIMR